MADFIFYAKIAGLVLGGALLMVSPIMIYMWFINKRQHHYFAKLAKQFDLQKDAAPKGIHQLVRTFPNVRGKYQDKLVQVYAGVSDESYAIHTSAGSSRYKTPLTILKVKPHHRLFDKMVLRATQKYKLKEGKSVDVGLFDEYFELEVDPQRRPVARNLLTADLQRDLLQFLVNYHWSSCRIELDIDGFWVNHQQYEMNNPKRYQRALDMLDILLRLSEQVSVVARQ